MPKKKGDKKEKEDPQFELGADGEGAEAVIIGDPKRIWRFPWEDEIDAWIGRATYSNRSQVILELLHLYLPEQTHMSPLYSKTDWDFEIKQSWNDQFPPEPELAVQLLTSIIIPEKSNHKVGDDPKYVAASIRRQRGLEAMCSMYKQLKEKIAELDDHPDIEVLRELYVTGASGALGYVPRSRLMRILLKANLTQGGDKQVSEYDEVMLTYRNEAAEEGITIAVGTETTKEETKEETIEEKFRRQSMNTQIRGLSARTLPPASKLPHGITDEVVDDKAKMKQYEMTARHIHALCADDNLVIDAFLRIDLNENKELGYGELSLYFNTHYPVLTTRHAMQKAFSDAGKSKDDVFVAPDDADANDVVDNGPCITPSSFKKFLMLTLFYSQLAVAFEILDWGHEEKIDRAGFEKGTKLMKKFLKLSDEELLFDEIAPEGETSFTFSDMCRWMREANEKHTSDIEYDTLMLERQEKASKVKKIIDVDSFADLVLFCHYNTRLPIPEFAFEERKK